MYVPASKRWIFNAICLSFYSKFKLRQVSAHKIIFDLIAPFCYELWAERNSVFLELIDQTNLITIFSVEILIQLSREKKTFKKHLQNKTTHAFLPYRTHSFTRRRKVTTTAGLWIFNSFFKTKKPSRNLASPHLQKPFLNFKLEV